MLFKILKDFESLCRFLKTGLEKIDATRVSTGKTWMLHNLLSGSMLGGALSFMALLNFSNPMLWGVNRIYAGLYLGLAVVAMVFQGIVYRRGHYFGQPKVVRF
jgi:hypothetical protein